MLDTKYFILKFQNSMFMFKCALYKSKTMGGIFTTKGLKAVNLQNSSLVLITDYINYSSSSYFSFSLPAVKSYPFIELLLHSTNLQAQ